jgi:hypothetical protein
VEKCHDKKIEINSVSDGWKRPSEIIFEEVPIFSYKSQDL